MNDSNFDKWAFRIIGTVTAIIFMIIGICMTSMIVKDTYEALLR